MLTRIRRLPSPALVISAIALVVAVGGGTFAIASSDNKKDKKIAKKIANKQIKKKAPDLSVFHAQSADSADSVNTNGVDTDAIQDNAVTTPKIADNAVTNTKIADDAVTRSKLADDAVGAAELGGTTQAVGASVPIGATNNATATVACPAGSQVLSGGGGTNDARVFGVESFQSGNGWLWFARNTDAAPHTIFATAVCLIG